MVKVEVSSQSFDMKTGVSARTGKPFSIREQSAWAYLVGTDGKPHPHPQNIKLTLGDDQQPYQPGNYQLALSSLYVDKYGQLSIRASLQPLAVRQAA